MVLRTKEYFYDKVEELLALETSPVSETEKNIKRRKAKKLSHPFHLVDSSPWPILMSFAAFNLVIGLVAFMHRFENSYFQLIIGLSGVILILILWWRDVIREGTRDGMHTLPVQLNLKFGFALFIVSEVMFFFGFFWAYFHFSLAPSIQIGCVWPPAGIAVMDPLGIPLLNTVLLLISGITVTISHHALIHNRLKFSARALDLTIIYAILFVFHQILEYFDANFSINDGIYGSVFFLLTGFHGFHVIIGAIFLGVCFVRLSLGHFTCFHHVGLESAIWYWHFVDVVWLGLYISIYWWGSLFVNFFLKKKMSEYSFKQIGFQSPATPIAEGIIDLHDYISFYLIIILVLVFFVYIDLFIQNFEIFNFYFSNILNIEAIELRRLYLILNRVNHATILEIVWTTIPSFILIAIAIPSLALLYSIDELFYPEITIKVTGFQWYWTYEYSDRFVSSALLSGFLQTFNDDYNIFGKEHSVTNFDDLFELTKLSTLYIESYMVNIEDLNSFKHHRLLSVDRAIVLPINTHIRVLVTGADVLHSWAVPSFGIKIDAVPGRLNQASIFLKRQGVFYGQCSELCGVNHAFMPIVVKGTSFRSFMSWVQDSMITNFKNSK